MKKYLLTIVTLVVLTVLGLIINHFNKSTSITINVKTDYGSKGDGINDDTKSIQKAIDQAPKGSTIIIPKGIYNINGNSKHHVVTEYGASNSVFEINKPLTLIMEGAVLKTKTSEKIGLFWINKTSDVTIKGGFLTGDVLPEDGGLTSRIGVLIQKSKNIKIENLSTRNFSQGITIYKSNKVYLKRCLTESNKGSGVISFRSSESIIDSCTIINSGDGHLSLYGGGKYNKVINNTIIENRANNNSQQGITVESEKNSLIKNNKVTGFYYGIDIKNGSEWCKIENNHVFNNKINITIREGDPNNLQTVSNNITISKNNVVGSRSDGSAEILVKVGDGHKIYGNTVTENQMILKNNVFNSNPISSKEVFDNMFVK